MQDKKEIWVLGNKSTVADKAFGWDENIPNITDADVVILDLSTLHKLKFPEQPSGISYTLDASTPSTIDEFANKLYASVTKHLNDKLLADGHVVYLLHYDKVLNYAHNRMKIIPFDIKMVEIPPLTKIYHTNHRFKEYLNRVQSVNYFLEVDKSIPNERVSAELDLKSDSLVTNKSNKTVGATFDMMKDWKPCGQLTLLPSIPPSTSSEMINAVISKLRGDASEPPPSWANNLRIPGVNEIIAKIASLESKKAKIEEEISKLESNKGARSKYGKLLYAYGRPLERIVRDVFVQLGFDEIAKPVGHHEDLKMDFKFVPDVDIGVLEVKGAIKRTKREALTQCSIWVNNYWKIDPSIKVKGILIPNQHRMSAYPKSESIRKHFEPNELEFAETYKICIIPTYVLFESVNKILSGQSPDRHKIEQLIFNTNGVLELIL